VHPVTCDKRSKRLTAIALGAFEEAGVLKWWSAGFESMMFGGSFVVTFKTKFRQVQTSSASTNAKAIYHFSRQQPFYVYAATA
jgi:hypothetical protein